MRLGCGIGLRMRLHMRMRVTWGQRPAALEVGRVVGARSEGVGEVVGVRTRSHVHLGRRPWQCKGRWSVHGGVERAQLSRASLYPKYMRAVAV